MSFNKYNMRQDGDVIITAGRVDMYDVATVCRFYGNKDTDTWGTEYYRDADLNGDGFIDITDLATVGYYYGESDDKWIVTRDPLIWWRNAGAKREKSWNGRLIWWSFTGEEPNEFQWWDAQGNTGTEPQWVADGAFQTLPTKGFYGRIKIYSDWYVTWPFLAAYGGIGIGQGYVKDNWTFGGYIFPEPSLDNVYHEARWKFKHNAIDIGDWYGLQLNLWGAFYEPICWGGVCDIELWEINCYLVLDGTLGLLHPLWPAYLTSIFGRGTDAERLKISVAFGRYDLGWGEPNVWKEADLSWNVQQAFGALILEAKALGYVTAIHPILELGNAEGELWIDYFQYHAPKK